MKKIGIVGVLVVILSIIGYLRFLEQQKIIQNFDETVGKYISQVQYFDQIELDFIPSSLEEIDYETKKNPDSFVDKLKGQFESSLVSYNSKNPWGLPLELDSDDLIQNMSLEEKIAQLFIFGFDGTLISPGEISFLKTHKPGGAIVMGKNVSSTLEQTIADIQATQTTLPLFISIDQEGGLVKRIDENLPSQPDVGMNQICDVYKQRSTLLKNIGINYNFGIVADITQDTNSFIYPRVFQGDAKSKISTAVRCTDTTLSTLKHFPGHGGTPNDTHQGIARISLGKSSREEADLTAFMSGIFSGADSIMMGHLIADFLDPVNPATLSPSTNDFVRDLGFTGLVVTDDMGMIESNGTWQTQLKQALLAGNDLILYVDGSNKSEILEYATALVKDGLITPQDLDLRLRRIISKKQKIIEFGDYVPLELVE